MNIIFTKKECCIDSEDHSFSRTGREDVRHEPMAVLLLGQLRLTALKTRHSQGEQHLRRRDRRKYFNLGRCVPSTDFLHHIWNIECTILHSFSGVCFFRGRNVFRCFPPLRSRAFLSSNAQLPGSDRPPQVFVDVTPTIRRPG